MADLQDEEIVNLIRLYQSQQNLYDFRMKVYYDRDKARESLAYISAQMGKNWDIETTKQRIKWLRNGYTRCRGMVERSRKRMPKIKWKWYHLLDPFLRDFCRISPRAMPSLLQYSQSQSTMDGEEMVPDSHPLDEEDEDSIGGPSSQHAGNSRSPPREAPNHQPSPSPSSESDIDLPVQFGEPERKRKRSSHSPTLELIKAMRADFQERREERRRKKESKDKCDKLQDENDTFCMYVATQLKQLNQRGQRQARMKIQKVLFDMMEENGDEEDVPASF